MNKLLNLIANYRFERSEDLGYMAYQARQQYYDSTLPLLEKAFPDEAERDEITGQISQFGPPQSFPPTSTASAMA